MYWTYRLSKKALGSYVAGVIDTLPANPLLHYDASDISTLWQNAGRTTPVTADGDTVSAWDPVEAQGTNYMLPHGSGAPQYNEGDLGFGPCVSGSNFREAVAGSGGGAVPPGGASPRFTIAVVSGARADSGQEPALLHWGGTTAGADLHWTVGVDGQPYEDVPKIVACGEKFALDTQAQIAQYKVSNGIIMAWYDGTDIVVSHNGTESVAHTIALNTLTSGTIASQGVFFGNFIGNSWSARLFQMHEFAVYDYVPSPAERASALAAMTLKWQGITDQINFWVDCSKPRTLLNSGSPATISGVVDEIVENSVREPFTVVGSPTLESTSFGRALRFDAANPDYANAAVGSAKFVWADGPSLGCTMVAVVSNISAYISHNHNFIFGRESTSGFVYDTGFHIASRVGGSNNWGIGHDIQFFSGMWDSGVAVTAGLHVVFIWYDGAGTEYLQVDGGAIQSHAYTPGDSVQNSPAYFSQVSARNNFDLHEVISYSRELPQAERDALYSQLLAKWTP